MTEFSPLTAINNTQLPDFFSKVTTRSTKEMVRERSPPDTACQRSAGLTAHALTQHVDNTMNDDSNAGSFAFQPLWRKLLLTVCVSFASISMLNPSQAETVIDNFSAGAQDRWEYIADTVMGGVSKGQVRFETIDGLGVLKLSGTVSTDNRGGFIQARLPLAQPLPDNAQGIWLKVRGNQQPYFVHLRTTGTLLPWQYYQGKFEAGEAWQIVKLPWSAFNPSAGFSSSLLRETPIAQKIKSIAIVAFGRDHQADVEVAEVGFY
jgi:hypothetical protein